MKAKDWFGIGVMIVLILGAIGWVMNIISLIHVHEMSGMVVARAIGILAVPLGAIFGWF
jgi:hypothetical protein